MEGPKQHKKPKIYDTEIQKNIEINKDLTREGESLIEEAFNLIRETIDLLDAETGYLEHMEGDKEYIMLEKDIVGETRAPKYSDEQMRESKDKIETYKKEIGELKLDIDQIILNNIHLDVINDRWNKIQNDYNNILLRIDKTQLN